MNNTNNELTYSTEDRRSFMLRSFATVFGLSSLATVSSAGYPAPEPPDAFHGLDDLYLPFVPQRVIVMTRSNIGGWPNRRRVDASTHTSMLQQFQRSTRKFDVIRRLMQIMTNYYRVPHLFGNWATSLAKREMLGSTGIGQGFGCFHQFQNDGWLQLATPPVDWWLALFPEGIDWESLDGEPVFGMIGHVFPSNHLHIPGTTLWTYCLTATIGGMIGMDPVNNWARIARLDKAIAARAVNQVISDRYHSELEALMRSADSRSSGILVTAGSGSKVCDSKATDDSKESQ